MDILSYLSELIQTRKTVGIPGLGTIYKKKSPGRYDAETHSFLPPSYTVDFTEEVKEEVLLSEFISKKRNVSADTATYFIEEFSNQVTKELNDQHKADFGSFGILKKQDDRLTLEPAAGLNTGFDFFGLPAVKAEAPVGQEIKPVSSEEIPVEPEVLGDPAETAGEIPVEETIILEEEADILVLVEETEASETEKADLSEVISIKEETINTGIHNDEADETEIPLAVIEEPYIKPSPEEVAVENQLEEENPGQETSDDLTAQVVPEIKKEEVIWQIKKPEPIAPFYSAPSQALHGNESDEPVEEEKTTPAYLKVLMVVVVLLIFIAGTYILKPELFEGITGRTNSAMQPAAKPQTATVPVVQPTDSSIIDTTKVSTAPPTVANRPIVKKDTAKKAPVLTVQDTAVTYEIIGAAVLNKKESDYFIYQMKQSGVTAKGLPHEPGKRIKMSLGTFKDRASATAEMEKLASKLKIKGIYIYPNKQK